MGFFGFGKKREVVDLGERFRKHQEKTNSVKASAITQASEEGFDVLENVALSSKTDSRSSSLDIEDNFDTGTIDDRRRRLAKRIVELTEKLEQVSNQIYHLQQRVELLERKVGVSSFNDN